MDVAGTTNETTVSRDVFMEISKGGEGKSRSSPTRISWSSNARMGDDERDPDVDGSEI